MSFSVPQKVELQILWYLCPWHYGEPYWARLIGTSLRNKLSLFQPLLAWVRFFKSLLPPAYTKCGSRERQCSSTGLLSTFNYQRGRWSARGTKCRQWHLAVAPDLFFVQKLPLSARFSSTYTKKKNYPLGKSIAPLARGDEKEGLGNCRLESCSVVEGSGDTHLPLLPWKQTSGLRP